jgi:hypothetical protein
MECFLAEAWEPKNESEQVGEACKPLRERLAGPFFMRQTLDVCFFYFASINNKFRCEIFAVLPPKTLDDRHDGRNEFLLIKEDFPESFAVYFVNSPLIISYVHDTLPYSGSATGSIAA